MCFPAWKRAAICLACIGLVVPQGAFGGQTKQPLAPSDTRLSAGGTLAGSVVDAEGKALADVTVTVKFRGHIIARTTTTKTGRFAVSGLRGGVHDIVTPTGRATTRFWATGTAPRAANSAVTLRAGKAIVRGQDDGLYVDPAAAAIGGLAVVATIAGIAAWADSDSEGPTSP